MSNYSGRRGPNVSQYIAELNTIPTPQEMVAQNQPLTVDEDFALFTNAEFFDFDMGEMPDLSQPIDYDPVQEERARRQNASRYNTSKPTDTANGEFSFPIFSSFPNVVDQSGSANYHQPAQPGAHYQFSPQTPPAASSSNEAHSLPGVATGDLHQLDGSHNQNCQVVVEEAARVAAEEDKRRRNTAASARFRIKKKQREQALERTAKEMTEKVQVLESKVTQLELENKWLKSLITEKNENKSDMTEMYKKLTDKKTDGERSIGERNNGVGTSEKDVKPIKK